ncbi:hypothetical protein QM201_02000 [Enterobacter asburiae]|nr:hypothetical protein [Enterobacter asburiae]
MLSEVIDWMKKNSSYNINVINNELTTSVVIDYDNEKVLARFIFWDDNSCMLEVMDINTGKYILNERHEVDGIKDFAVFFEKFKRSLE